MASLQLGPSCCCKRPGILRSDYDFAYAVVHPSELTHTDAFYRLPNYDAWMVPWAYAGSYDGYAHWNQIMFPYPVGLGHLMAYVPTTDELVFCPGGYVNTSVRKALLSSCSDGLISHSLLITESAGADIFDMASPSGTVYFLQNFWSSASADRLYGFTTWHDGTNWQFKSWSVDRTGSDFTVIATLSAVDGDGLAPHSMTYQGGHLYTAALQDYFYGDTVKIYKDDDLVATVGADGGLADGLDFFVGLSGGFGSGNAVILEVAGQLIAYSASVGKVYLLVDGDDFDAHEISFVEVIDSVEHTLYPMGMGWDSQKQAVVITWSPTELYGAFGTYWASKYATYHTEALTAGNIVGQDGVLIYALHLSGGYFGTVPNSPKSNLVIIPGTMPLPLTVVAGVIEESDPPPPPPDPPTCDTVEDCESPVATMRISYFRDHTASDTDTLGPNEAIYRYSNINGTYSMRSAEATDPFGAGYTGDGWFYVSLGEVMNYSDPGILIVERDYTDSIWRRELYLYGIYLHTSCSDGVVSITEVLWVYQGFWGRVGGDYPWEWPTFEFQSGNTNALTSTGGGAIAGTCSTSDMSAVGEDDIRGVTFSDDFVVNVRIGAIS